MASSDKNSFVNSNTARLLALVIAVALALLFFLSFGDQVGQPLMSEPETSRFLPPVEER